MIQRRTSKDAQLGVISEWELARYLIDAKRCIDSLMYIDANRLHLRFLNLHGLVRTLEGSLYLNSVYVLDHLKEAAPEEYGHLRDTDRIIKRIFIERNKNVGHKDYVYEDRNPKYLGDRIQVLKERLVHVREICRGILPPNVTLDYVPHDPVLYRVANGITAEVEEGLGNKGMLIGSHGIQTGGNLDAYIFQDTEQYKTIKRDRLDKEKAVIPKADGLNYYESLQNFQDSLIKVNVLTGGSVWMGLDAQKAEIIEESLRVGKITTLMWAKLNVTDAEVVDAFQNVFKEVV